MVRSGFRPVLGKESMGNEVMGMGKRILRKIIPRDHGLVFQIQKLLSRRIKTSNAGGQQISMISDPANSAKGDRITARSRSRLFRSKENHKVLASESKDLETWSNFSAEI